MKLLAPTIAAIFLGNLVPGAQSYKNHFQRALSEALEASDFGLDLDWEGEPDGRSLDGSFIHQRRAEQTITQQCLDDTVLLNNEDVTHSTFMDRFRTQGCSTMTQMESMAFDDGYAYLDNFGDCPLVEAEYRTFCEENYQYVKHRDLKMLCTVKALGFNETELELLFEFTVRNTGHCEPLSCPSDGNDWTSDDYAAMYVQEGLTCGCEFYDIVCTHEFLVEEEEHGDSHDEKEEDTHSADHGSHDHGSHDDEGETEATDMVSGGVSAWTSSVAAAALMGVVTALW